VTDGINLWTDRACVVSWL